MRFCCSTILALAVTLLCSCGVKTYSSSSYRPYAPVATPYIEPATPDYLPVPAFLDAGSSPVAQKSTPAPMPGCASACVMDAKTGKLLFEYNARQRRQVASTQKILTALVVIKSGSLNTRVVIQPEDTKCAPTVLGLRAGDSYTRGELLRALLVKSYNDVAKALARSCAGSEENFISAMNDMASRIGMENSYFVNPNGLPDAQYSTAYDMAKCAFYAYRYPAIRNIVATKQFQMRMPSGRVVTVDSTNKLLTRMPGVVNGMKTGFTNAAGRCLVSTATYKGRHVIVVVLGCSPSRIWDESKKLIDWSLISN